mgnify:CR=1 FL=1
MPTFPKTASLTFSSLGTVAGTAAVNFITPNPATNIITLTGQATTTAATLPGSGRLYINGSNFARINAGQVVTPVYGTDAGFVNAGAALTASSHNRLASSIASQAAVTVSSLKIDGSQSLNMAGTLTVSLSLSRITFDQAASRAPLRAGSFAHLVVSDTGPGMDEATRRRIFEPYYSTSPARSGLGLAVVQSVVTGHDGERPPGSDGDPPGVLRLGPAEQHPGEQVAEHGAQLRAPRQRYREHSRREEDHGVQQEAMFVVHGGGVVRGGGGL